MKSRTLVGPVVVLLIAFFPRQTSAWDEAPLKAGDAVPLAGRTAIIKKLDALPFVDSDYSKRFRFDAYENPKLKELRETYKLDAVVAPGKDEFDRQVLLLDWVHQRFNKFGKPTSDARGALAVLKANADGHAFFCTHYADVLVSAAASLGWVDRSLALRRPDGVGEGATEHTSTEIWSNQYRKWVMFDPTFAMYVERDGIPLSAYEVRQEWCYREGRDLVFVIGKERKKYRNADLPILRKRFAGFGDLSVTPTALHVYAFIGYIPNTNLMDAGPDYAKMFIVQDKVGEGTKWHRRVVPANPAEDPYFPIGQAALTLDPEGGNLRVALRTLTPNFKTFLVRIDGGEWQSAGDAVAWSLRPGENRLEAKTVNRFGVEGPISTAEIEIKGDGKDPPRLLPAKGKGAYKATDSIPSAHATQAAATDEKFVYAVSNTHVVKYDRATGKETGSSKGEAAQHLNSAFLWEGNLYCAHSNYPKKPDQSDIRVLDPTTMELKTFHTFADPPGSLTWAVRRDGHWWCHFAHYGKDNAKSLLVKYDDGWRELSRWTYPPELVADWGTYSLSGGLWQGDDLLTTGHDRKVLYRLRLPKEGKVVQLDEVIPSPFTGQGIASDPKTGGLVGIDRGKKAIVFGRFEAR